MSGAAMSYEELDRRANQLARTLQHLGVKRGDRVGVYLPKSFEAVVGVFGIMKAGACYVPLDVNAPAARLAYILRDCDISVLLSEAAKLPHIQEVFTAAARAGAIVLMTADAVGDSDVPSGVRITSWAAVTEQDERPLPATGAIDTDLAYILYTSGSTGAPKGVMISHRTILTFINWSHDFFCLSSDDRVTSHAPLHFDLSTFDLYATVKAGGTIVLVRDHVSVLPEQVVRLIAEERVTVTYLVPSILSMMVRYGKLADHDLSSLRAVLFAGEVFPIKYLRQLMTTLPQAQVLQPVRTN